MVVNFKACGISRGASKLARILMLIKKKLLDPLRERERSSYLSLHSLSLTHTHIGNKRDLKILNVL
jgi:hypothetical protein